MIIWIENREYQLISNAANSIHIDYKNPELPVIYASASLSIDELTTYVKQYAKKNRLITQAETESFDFFTINLFDNSYPVKPINEGKSKPYLKNNIIYFSKSEFKSKTQKKLEESIHDIIFEQSILVLIAKWEEILNILVEEVIFKKLPSNYYKISNQKLLFNKKNSSLSLKINEYLILKALLDLTESKSRIQYKLEQYFSDHKQIEKILAYGN